MNTRNRIWSALTLIALFGAALTALSFGSRVETVSAASPEATAVIAAGLNNPRGLNFGPEGALYVAEAGRGGAGPCAPGPEGTRCYGATGSITRVDRRGTVTRLRGAKHLVAEKHISLLRSEEVLFSNVSINISPLCGEGRFVFRTLEPGH